MDDGNKVNAGGAFICVQLKGEFLFYCFLLIVWCITVPHREASIAAWGILNVACGIQKVLLLVLALFAVAMKYIRDSMSVGCVFGNTQQPTTV